MVLYQIKSPGKLPEDTCFYTKKIGTFSEGGVITEKGGRHYQKGGWVDRFPIDKENIFECI